MAQLLMREGILDRLKESRGIQTDEAMAAVAQVSLNTYKAYRDRKTSPNTSFIARVGAAFGMGPGELAEIVDSVPLKATA